MAQEGFSELILQQHGSYSEFFDSARGKGVRRWVNQ